MEPLPTALSPSRKMSTGVDQGSSLYHRKVAHTKGAEEGEEKKEKYQEKEVESAMNEMQDMNTRRRVANKEDGEIKSEGYQKQVPERKKEGEQLQIGERILFALIIITCICWIGKTFGSFMG